MTDFNKLLLHIGESNYDHAYWQQHLSREYQTLQKYLSALWPRTHSLGRWARASLGQSLSHRRSKRLGGMEKSAFLFIFLSKNLFVICDDEAKKKKRSSSRFPVSERRRRLQRLQLLTRSSFLLLVAAAQSAWLIVCSCLWSTCCQIEFHPINAYPFIITFLKLIYFIVIWNKIIFFIYLFLGCSALAVH